MEEIIKSEIDKLNAGDIVYKFGYNIGENNKFVSGSVALTKKYIFAYDEYSGVRYYDLDKIDTVKCVIQTGSVSIDFKYENRLTQLCRANMAYKNIFPDFTAQFDLFLRDRDKKIEDKSEKEICPKCGGYYEPGTEFCAQCANKLKTFGRILKLAASHRSRLVIAVILFALTSAIALLIPAMQRTLVDEYIFAGSESPGLANSIRFVDILWIMLGIVSLNLAIEILRAVRSLLLARVSSDLSFNLRSMIFSKIQESSIAKISKRTPGELINRVQWDTQEIDEYLVFGLPDTIQQAFLFIIIGAVVFAYNWKLALIVLVPMPFFLLINSAAITIMHNFFEKAWTLRSRARAILHDVLSGIRVVKSYGTERQEIEKCSESIKKLAEIDMKSEQIWNVFSPIANFVMRAGSYFMTLYVGNQILGNVMTRGEMIQFTTYMSMLYGPLEWMGFMGRWTSWVLTSAAKIFEIVDEKRDVVNQDKAVKKDIDGYIGIKDMYFGYKDYDMVLRDINLSVQPGEMIGIVGRSGVGKSTLINMLMRLYDVNEGQITIDGIDIKDYDQNNLRSQIGAVLQETFLFSGTIYENIAYAKATATKDEIMRAAKFANAHQFIMKLPDGYNTKVGEHGHTLSGGERQRIAIARAVLHDPRILILDEATSALDTETESLVQDALQKLIKNRTTFAIAHRLSTLRNSTRLIILDKGTIAEMGTHEQLMAKKGIYYSLVMAQRQMSKMAIAKNE
ncbi:MAG: ABC transporter ATP-binding protein/permease [Oscillospiraceae bacterium]|nr:ABC transporter ATP-binding protein/permease [Oscillospiraceae bacterium]